MLISGGFDKSVRLWEVASGKERRVITGHTAAVRSIAPSTDGKTIASGSSDGTNRVQPLVASNAVKPAQKLDMKELEAYWTTLAGEDAPRAYQAVLALKEAAGQSVPFLQERVQQGAKVDEIKLAKLIAELDDDQFAVREKATQELEQQGDLAVDALRKALTGTISVEARRRIEAILDKQTVAAMLTPDRQRLVRALEVLENAGTPEARQALRKLAEGAGNPILAREAQAALKRLEKMRNK
jgi:hypothetical protein